MMRLFYLICTVVFIGCYPLKNPELKPLLTEEKVKKEKVIVKKTMRTAVPIDLLPNTKVEAIAEPPTLASKHQLRQSVTPVRYKVPTFYPVTQPSQRIRNDGWGDGFFRASRGRRIHNGLDIIVVPNTAVYSPIEGIVTRKAYPYGEKGRNKQWEGIVIKGVNAYKGYEVKIFYMIPFNIGSYVYPDTVIGLSQAISGKYSSTMIDHLHVEVRFYGQLRDPAHLFNLIE